MTRTASLTLLSALLPALLLALTTLASGCASLRTRFPKMPLLGFQAIEPEASAADICRALNTNVRGSRGEAGLSAWRSEGVRVKLSGVPVSLPATLAVQAPRDLRLRVSHPMMGSDKADLGSNDDRFWFWAEDGGPRLFTARHEHTHMVARQLQIPFEPEWIIDVLGVTPLDPQGMEKRPTPDPHVVELAKPYRMPDGHAAERICRVNLRDGEIVGHELRQRGRMIARADIDEWTLDRRTGLKTPKVIRMAWPEADTSMTLRISGAEVNPPSLTTALFELPRRPNVEVADLSEAAAARELLAAGPRAGQTLLSDPTLQKGLAAPQPPGQTGPTVTMADPKRSQPQHFQPQHFQPLDATPLTRSAANVSRSLPVADPASDFGQSAGFANPAADFQPVQGTPVRFGLPPGRSVQPVSGRDGATPWDAAPAADPWAEASVTIDEF